MTRKIKKRNDEYKAGVGVSGFYRVNIVDPDGTLSGDSGWNKNLIGNLGLANFIAYKFASSGGSTALTPSYIMMGSSSATAASTLNWVSNGFASSKAASIATSSHATRGASTDGHTVRFLATFTSNGMFTTTCTIANIGIVHSDTSVSSAMCTGNFTSSTLGSNQAVNVSYDIVFIASTS